jgi:hypothetical protein
MNTTSYMYKNTRNTSKLVNICKLNLNLNSVPNRRGIWESANSEGVCSLAMHETQTNEMFVRL